MEKRYNILVMVRGGSILWMDSEGNFGDREFSKVFLKQEAELLVESIRTSGLYVMCAMFPVLLDWVSIDKVHYSSDKLHIMLESCLLVEDYENACILRDKINSIV